MHPSQAAAPASITVDVAIPTLGESPSYLEEAIKSVFAQTLSTWRLTISENGGTDACVARVLERYLSDPRVVHRVVNSRVSQAQHWTDLIQLGHAPYIALLHDDDRWSERFLERRVRFLDEHESCGFVFSGHGMIGEESENVGNLALKLAEGVHRRDSILPQLYEYNLVGPPTVLVRRTAYEAIGSTYRNVMLTDHDMWLRLAALFDVGFLSGSDSDMRIHSTQVSVRRRLELGEAHLEVIRAAGDLPIPTSIQRRVEAQAHLCRALDCVELANRGESLAELWKTFTVDRAYFLHPTTTARACAALLALAFGKRGRTLFGRLRYRRFSQRATGIATAQRDY